MSHCVFDECYKEKYMPENAGVPDEDKMNPSFLAYGFFKPHQLAYSQIKRFIDGKPKKMEVYHRLKNVNGMPVLLKEYSTFPHKHI